MADPSHDDSALSPLISPAPEGVVSEPLPPPSLIRPLLFPLVLLLAEGVLIIFAVREDDLVSPVDPLGHLFAELRMISAGVGVPSGHEVPAAGLDRLQARPLGKAEDLCRPFQILRPTGRPFVFRYQSSPRRAARTSRTWPGPGRGSGGCRPRPSRTVPCPSAPRG